MLLLVWSLLVVLAARLPAGAGAQLEAELLFGLDGRQARAVPQAARLPEPARRLLDAYMAAQEEGDQRSYGGPVTSKIPFRKWVYPSGQFLPTCAPQQVCNTVYPRLQRTNPQCVCPRGATPCSPLIISDDHTVQLVTDHALGPLTAVKTCETSQDIRECANDDWALLAVQNARSGKSNFLVICRCPADGSLDGPMQHTLPHYAHVPTIRIYGMLCRRKQHQYHHHRFRRQAKTD